MGDVSPQCECVYRLASLLGKEPLIHTPKEGEKMLEGGRENWKEREKERERHQCIEYLNKHNELMSTSAVFVFVFILTHAHIHTTDTM